MSKKVIEIFKAGSHTSAGGEKIDFTEDMVKQIAENYNAKKYAAPCVVGHPKHNSPAYGWIEKVFYDDDRILKAVPEQLNPAFVEAVKDGAFKTISVSLYAPDSPNNPTPNQYSLRHVGFLGAMPPAVKGLKAVEFSEDDETVELEIDFSESNLAYNDKSIARLFRNLKNFLIGKFSQEEADNIFPEYEIESLANEAEHILSQPAVPDKSDFSEAKEELNLPAEPQPSAELITAQKKAAELEALLAKEKQEKQAKANADFCDSQVKAGRLLPAHKANVIQFMASLNPDTVDFGEDGAANQLDNFKKIIESLPPQVNFSEVAPAEEPAEDFSDPHILADKAVEYRKEQAAAGKEITISEAVFTLKGKK